MTQFLHVQCQQFGLLVEVGRIHEVIGRNGAGAETGADDQAAKDTLTWRGEPVPVLNLTAELTGDGNATISDFLVLSGDDEALLAAVGVSKVVNIESLDENDFSDIPFLDFPFNDYFDKAYVRPATQECIYRLKDITSLVGNVA